MEKDAIRIAEWIFGKAGLDKYDETWCGMMFEDVVKALIKQLEKGVL